MRVKAVVFDLDDTLISWAGQTGSYGDLTERHVHSMYGYMQTAVSTTLPNIDDFFLTYRTTIQEDWLGARGVWLGVSFYNSLVRFFQKLELDITQIDFDAVMHAYDWRPVEGVDLYPDTIDTLTTLKNGGQQIGLITNSMLPMWMRDVELETYGLLNFFDARTTSGDVEAMKPHTAVFQHILDQLNLVPEEAMYVGDNPLHDIDGANNTGMISTLIDPPHLNRQKGETEPDYTITALNELIPILETLEK